MKRSAHESESRKMEDGCCLMRKSIDAGLPANTFIVVDTHSEEFSGLLQHTGGNKGGTNTTLAEILKAYLGPKFYNVMQESSVAARSSVAKSSDDKSWSDSSAHGRGGWRGVFLLSCGPAVRAQFHFDSMRELITQ